jgi:rapamycin-insensitive companion of mTOR
MAVLEAHHFRLGMCRFVIDLFDKRVMRQIVLEEDDSDDSTNEGESEEGETTQSSNTNESGA